MGDGSERPAQTHELDDGEALAAAVTAAWRWENGGAVVKWSTDAAAILDVPEIILRSPDLLLQAIHPADLSLVTRPTAESWATGAPVGGRIRLLLADRTRWFEVAGRVVLEPSGAPSYATGTVREITDAQEAAEAVVDALREAEEVLAQLGAGVGEWDRETDVVRIFTGLSGLGLTSPGEMHLDAVLRNMDDLGRSRLRAALPRAIEADEPFAVEVKMKGSDGEVRRVMVKGGASPRSSSRVRLVALVLG